MLGGRVLDFSAPLPESGDHVCTHWAMPSWLPGGSQGGLMEMLVGVGEGWCDPPRPCCGV